MELFLIDTKIKNYSDGSFIKSRKRNGTDEK